MKENGKKQRKEERGKGKEVVIFFKVTIFGSTFSILWNKKALIKFKENYYTSIIRELDSYLLSELMSFQQP